MVKTRHSLHKRGIFRNFLPVEYSTGIEISKHVSLFYIFKGGV